MLYERIKRKEQTVRNKWAHGSKESQLLKAGGQVVPILDVNLRDTRVRRTINGSGCNLKGLARNATSISQFSRTILLKKSSGYSDEQ